MGVKPGYKQTEMGIIPEEWDAKAIGTEIDLLTGFPFPSSGYSKAGVRLLRGSNIKRGQTDWSDEITKYWPAVTRDLIRYTMMAGDLVVSMDGSLVGRSFAQLEESDLPALLLQRVARIRGTKLDVTYLRQFVGSDQFVKYVDSVKTVTAIPHISPSDIRKFTIPLPPTLPEQRVIATALSDVDSLLSVLDRLTAKKRDLKQAAMQQLLTGKTRLPGFHGEWEVRSLAAICSMKSGEGITSANIDQFSKYPCYGGNGLRGFASKFTHVGKYALIGRQGALCGNVFGVEGQFFASEHAIVVTASADTDIRWLTYVLGRMNLNQYSESSAQPGLSVSKILKLDLATPPTKAEQTAIAEVLTDMDAELAVWEQRREKIRALKQGMMQELLTGRTRLV